MSKFVEIFKRNKKIFAIIYVSIIMLLIGVLVYYYANRPEEEEFIVEDLFDTTYMDAEAEAVTNPDGDTAPEDVKPYKPEDIESLVEALPFYSTRFSVVQMDSGMFVVELYQEFSEIEKQYVLDWFERFPEIKDSSVLKIIWVDKVEDSPYEIYE